MPEVLADIFEKRPVSSEAEAVEAILAAQRAGGDAVDPAGARKFIRMLIAVGLLKFGG